MSENTSVSPAVTKAVKSFTISGAKAVAQREDKAVEFALRDEFGDPLMTEDDTGKQIPAVAMIVGKLSKTYRDATMAVDDKTLKRRATELTALSLEDQELEKLAKCVKSWNLRDGKTPISCDVFNVKTVLLAAPWIRRDLDNAMGDSARFLV